MICNIDDSVRGARTCADRTPGGGPTRLDPAGGDPDPLNTAALSVWGFMRAGFGVDVTLLDGLVAVNSPAAALEGARWNVSVRGRSACVRVHRGASTFCNGTAIPPARKLPVAYKS